MIAEKSHDGAQTTLVATFEVGDTLCGIDAMTVQEVVRPGEVTRVHHAPTCIVGIINLRGKIVTVIDLGVALHLGRSSIGSDSRIFIVEWNGEYVGLLADRAGDVAVVTRELIVSPPANIRSVQGRFFDGVYQADDKLIAILNVGTLLSESGNDR